MNKKFIAIILALLVTAGAVTYIAQQETPVEPTVAPIETPAESPAESPVEEDTAVEGQLNADGAEGEGKLDGSAGENIYDMTNYMESLTDSNSGTKVDQEYAFDLEEQKQETPVEEGTVGSDTGSGNGSGSVGTGSNGAGNGTGNSSVGGGSVGEGNNIPTQNPDGTLDASNVKPDDRFTNKESLESLGSVDKVLGYNEEFGGHDTIDSLGRYELVLPDGTAMSEEFLDILRQYGK